MAEGKTADVHLNIIAQVKNFDVFGKINNAMKGMMKSVGLAELSLAGLASGAAAVVLGFKGLQKVGDFVNESIKAAKEAAASEEKLGAALARNKKLQEEEKKRPGVLKEQQEELVALANVSQKSGVQFGAAMTNAFAKLTTAGYGPAHIAKISKGFEGFATALKGVGASKEDLTAVATLYKGIIKTGKVPKGLAKEGLITQAEIKAMKAATSEKKRAAIMDQVLARNEWRVDAAVKSTAGRVFHAKAQWESLKETIGKPFVESQAAFADASANIAEALMPLAEGFAKIATPAIRGFASWMSQAGKDFKEFTTRIGPMWDDVMKQLGVGWDVIAAPMKEGAAWFTANVVKPIGDAFKPVIDPIKTAFDGIWTAVKPSVDSFMLAFKSYFAGDIKLTDLEKNLKLAWDRAFDQLGKIDWTKIAKNIEDGIAGIDWGKITEAIKAGGQRAFDNAFTFASNAGQLLMNRLQQVNWGDVANIVGQGIGNALKAIAWVALLPMELGSKLGTAIGNAIANIKWSDVVNVSNMLYAIGDKIDEGIGKAAEWGAKMAVKLVEGIIQGLTGQKLDLSKLFDDALKTILDTCKSWGPKIVDSIVSGIKAIPGGGWLLEKFGVGTTPIAPAAPTPTAVPAAVTAPAQLADVKQQTEMVGGSAEDVKSIYQSWAPAATVVPELDQVKGATSDVKTEMQAVVTAAGGIQINPSAMFQLDALAAKARETASAMAGIGGTSAALAPVPAPAMQHGGLVDKATLAMIGEGGPEAVVPLQRNHRSLSLLATAARALGVDLDKINIGGLNVGKFIEGMTPGGLGAAEQLGGAMEALSAGRPQGLGRGINLSMSSPITINGVPAGQEGAVGREVSRSMNESVNRLLEELKKARDEERRLAYV
jgi:hypothetical protein